MIVYRRWTVTNQPLNRVEYDGWYLFGAIPLYKRVVILPYERR